MTSAGYLRFPHLHGDLVTFVAEDDVWLAPQAGGRAWRLSADSAQVAHPRFARDGGSVAWASWRDGPAEVYLAEVDGAPARRLTYWGEPDVMVAGWTPDGEVLALSATGQAFERQSWGYAVPVDGGPARPLRYGPVAGLAIEPAAEALLNGSWGRDPAFWKRYRGGTAGRLWTATGGAPFQRILAEVNGQFASPMLIGDRLAFLSDHEGTGNLYSCRLDGTGLLRHTDHDGGYARHAGTDGRRVIYQVRGELWILDELSADSEPRPVPIQLSSAATGLAPRLVSAADHLGDLSCDETGLASAVEVRGTVHWLTHRDGPARALAVAPDARARLPRVLGRSGQVAWITRRGRHRRGGDRARQRPRPGRRHGTGRRGRPAPPGRGPARAGQRAGRSAGREHGGGRDPRRPAAADRRGLRRGARARAVSQRRAVRPGLRARFGLAGLVASGPGPAAAHPAGPAGRRHRAGRDRRAVRRLRAGVHHRREVPGLPVRAGLRPGL